MRILWPLCVTWFPILADLFISWHVHVHTHVQISACNGDNNVAIEATLGKMSPCHAACVTHPPSPAAALGTLDFSLLYDQENNALHCTISKAKVGPAPATAQGSGSRCCLSFLPRLPWVPAMWSTAVHFPHWPI